MDMGEVDGSSSVGLGTQWWRCAPVMTSTPAGESRRQVMPPVWPRRIMRCRPPACASVACLGSRPTGMPGAATATASSCRCRCSQAARKVDVACAVRRPAICARSSGAGACCRHADSDIWKASSRSFTSGFASAAIRYLHVGIRPVGLSDSNKSGRASFEFGVALTWA